VILDEATAGVDVDARRLLIEFVHRLAQEGTAILFSTHYLQEVDRNDMRLVILDRGRVIAEGATGPLLRQYGHSAVELSFDGPPPAVVLPFAVARNGHTLRIRTESPAEVLAVALQALGPDAGRLTGVEITRPSLEGVFAELTGRRFDAPSNLDDDVTEAEARVV
jgi:ABC-2 type transport system ATP-binding protein